MPTEKTEGSELYDSPAPSAGCCSRCGTWRPVRHRDHIIPRSEGGSNDPSNIQMLCGNCHDEKTWGETQRRNSDPEYLERMRLIWDSPEWRGKISDAALLRGDQNEELGRLVGESRRGVQLSDEHKKKVGDAQRGRPKSPEHRRKLSEAQRGIPCPARGRREVVIGAD